MAQLCLLLGPQGRREPCVVILAWLLQHQQRLRQLDPGGLGSPKLQKVCTAPLEDRYMTRLNLEKQPHAPHRKASLLLGRQLGQAFGNIHQTDSLTDQLVTVWRMLVAGICRCHTAPARLLDMSHSSTCLKG